MQIITSKDDLTAEWFSSVLASADGRDGPSVVDVTVGAIGTGQLSRMVRAHLTYDGPTDAPETVIVKYPSDDQGSLGFALAVGMYEVEVLFYREVAPLLPDMALPRCHHAEVDLETGMFTLVLEDLSSSTRPGDVLTESTPEQCATVLEQLAHLQAPLWNSSAATGMDWLADPRRTTTLFDGLPQGLEPFLDRFGAALGPGHPELFRALMPKVPQWVRNWSQPTVVQHGDFRTDNVLWGAASGMPPATIIDFQLARLGPSGFDPAYFLGSALSTEVRRSAERELIGGYHAHLVAGGVSDWDFEQCWNAYREGSLYGVAIFCGVANQVEATERGDRMVADQIRRYADMALDLDALEAAGLD